MFETQDEFTFYGIDNISEKLDHIISNLDVGQKYFEIKLIMFEAITNAFIHGNKKDKTKPIVVKWKKEEDYLDIAVKDCGLHRKKISMSKEIDKNSILEENGRGLYIISAYTDEVKFEDGCIMMKKSLL